MPQDKLHTHQLHVKVTPEQLKRYRLHADARGMRISSWIRLVLDEEVNRKTGS